MTSLRAIVPLVLTSLGPAIGDTAAASCTASNWSTPYCEAERAGEFAAARNAEINASIAAVAAARADLATNLTHCKSAYSTAPRCEVERALEMALSTSHCKSADSTTPRCEVERAREFAAARNAEINASIAKVAHVRWLAAVTTHCQTADTTTPRCEAERTREFAAARNAEINASIAAVAAERARTFAAARNAEIERSLAAVARERARSFAAARNAEINASIAMVDFVRARNAEIKRSLAAVARERARSFAAARNAEINASIAAVKAVREREFAAARNAEINASIAAVAFVRARNAEIDASVAVVQATREREFAAARNAEINASIATVQAQRAIQAAANRINATMETGALPLMQTPAERPAPTLHRTLSADPCSGAADPVAPLQFSGQSAVIEDGMKSELDRLAEMARNCPAVQIEIHGHSSALGPAQVTRSLAERRAQAARDYLTEQGVDNKRLGAVGHGDREPFALAASESSAANDRVEFVVQDPARDVVASRIMTDLAELLEQTSLPSVAGLDR